jgi:hypothetical protein
MSFAQVTIVGAVICTENSRFSKGYRFHTFISFKWRRCNPSRWPLKRISRKLYSTYRNQNHRWYLTRCYQLIKKWRQRHLPLNTADMLSKTWSVIFNITPPRENIRPSLLCLSPPTTLYEHLGTDHNLGNYISWRLRRWRMQYCIVDLITALLKIPPSSALMYYTERSQQMHVTRNWIFLWKFKRGARILFMPLKRDPTKDWGSKCQASDHFSATSRKKLGEPTLVHLRTQTFHPMRES